MSSGRIFTASLIVLLGVTSCETIMSFVQDGKVVAKVGSHKLYLSQVTPLIPDTASPDDSTHIALQYIDSWVSEQVFTDIAEKELSKEEKDVSEELEDYRRSLLKYRYEQKYINRRLDTSVTAAQIEEYYEKHISNFTLKVPIVKASFVNISPESPNLSLLRKKMMSEDNDARRQADSLAYYSAYRYTDFGGHWIDVIRLSREFGTDYGTLLSQMRGGVIEMPDAGGNLNIAFIHRYLQAGDTGPEEYYTGQIRDIILSTRKQALLSGLERDLLDKARAQERFTIY